MIKQVRIWLLLLFCAFNYVGIGSSLPEFIYKRQKIDSLLKILPLSTSDERFNILMGLSKQYLSFSLDSSKEYALLALDQAEMHQDSPDMATAYKAIGSIYYYLGHYSEVIVYYDSSLAIYRQVGDSSGLSKVWNNMGLVFQKMGEYEKSIEYHLKSLDFKINIADSAGMASSYNNIGSIYYDLEDYSKSFEYFRKALEIAQRLDNKQTVASIMNNLGLISQEEGKYNESLDYFNQSLKVGEEINYTKGIADNFHNIGKSYFELGNFKTGLEYYFKALENYKSIGLEASTTLNNIGQVYIDLDYYSQAKKYLLEALETAKENSQFKILREIYQNLSVVYERTGDYKNAHEYYILFNSVDDSLRNQMYSSRLEDIHNKYELEKHQEQFKMMEAQNKLKLDHEVRRRNLIMYSTLSIILAILIFVFILIRLLRQKARANFLLKDQNEEILKSDNIIKKINKALKENEEMLRSIFDVSPYSILVINEERKITDCNHTSLKMFETGKKRKMIMKQYDDLFAPSNAEQAVENFRKAFENNPVESMRYEMLKENGKSFHADLSGRVLRDVNGKPIAFIAIVTDITDRISFIRNLQQAKTVAESSDKLKTAFLANMSHEIRTPMNAIIGFSNLLADPSLSQNKREEYLSHIIQSSNLLLNLIDDIIDISKIEAGQINISNQDVQINTLVRDIYRTFRNVNKNKNINLNINLPQLSDNYVCKSDPVRLRQILSNLIGNALKFTEKGYVEIGYTIKDIDDESHVEFFVKDSGIGIPVDKQDLIFERFRQVDDSRTRRFGGTGLGLSISKRLVELLGGSIRVVSQEGAGSEFYFTIPFKREDLIEQEEAEPFSLTKYNWKNKTILIAEDENSNFELIKASIQKTGIKIIRAINGEDAVEVVGKNNSIDLVLMDIRMPKMNGYDATRSIKAIKPGLPVISITAYAMSEDEVKSLEAGCDRYISKPIRPTQLLAVIEGFLD
ncbi:MAG: tetratricopeptide repeat protein [Bacteroidales bacterium]|nr:tetratricopeptide repeat protein [Bacteroidales bacterium]